MCDVVKSTVDLSPIVPSPQIPTLFINLLKHIFSLLVDSRKMGCFGGTQLLVCLLSVCIAVDLARADCIWYDECGCNPDLDPGWQCSLLYLNRCTGPIGFFSHKVEFLNSFLIIFCGEYNEVHLKNCLAGKKLPL